MSTRLFLLPMPFSINIRWASTLIDLINKRWLNRWLLSNWRELVDLNWHDLNWRASSWCYSKLQNFCAQVFKLKNNFCAQLFLKTLSPSGFLLSLLSAPFHNALLSDESDISLLKSSKLPLFIGGGGGSIITIT